MGASVKLFHGGEGAEGGGGGSSLSKTAGL